MPTPTTVDSLLDGSLIIEQPAPGHGYRVNADAILLARFASESVQGQPDVIDLGAGVGTVALAIHTLAPVRTLTLVERDEVASKLSLKNVARAGLTDRSKIALADVELWSQNAALEGDCVVVANPPYTKPGAGRRGGEPSRDAARHGDLMPFVLAMRELLEPSRHHACMCYPAPNVIDAVEMTEQAGLSVRRMRLVHPCEGRPARIVLLEFVSGQSVDRLVLSPWLDNESLPEA